MVRPKSHSLEETLGLLPRPAKLPLSLPLAHLTVARWFESIIDAGKLEPRMCDTFKENLVYLSYGGVLYRTANWPTKNPSELPVVFIFNPSLLEIVDRYYPFDTGALAKGRYGKWSKILGPNANQFKLLGKGDSTVPSRLVYHLYKNNKQYIKGHVDSALKKKPDPLPQLLDFFKANLTAAGVDDRQLAIEAVCTESIPFDDRLVFVGYPEVKTRAFRPLFEKLYELMKPVLPEFFPYESSSIITPNEIAAQIRLAARKSIVERYLRLP